MSVAFLRGQVLGPNDLNIFIEDAEGHPLDPAEITYALYDFTTGQEVLLGIPRRTPAHPSLGEYFCSVVIPLDANVGDYRIRWTFRERSGGPETQVVQEFAVVSKDATVTTPYTTIESQLIRSLRILTRDNNPAKNYRWSPPEYESTVRQHNRVFGYVWEDEELYEYIQRGLDMVIAAPPRTPFASLDQMVQSRPEWRTLLLNASMMNALRALILNWTHEEFSLKGDSRVMVRLPSGEILTLSLEELYRCCKDD